MHASTSPVATTPAAPRPASRRLRDPRLWLVLYALVLGVIAFWPVPVDRGAEGLLKEISSGIPWLSYAVIEATANVLLFVPLGILLARVLPRRRWLVVPIAFVATMTIEFSQALLLSERTPSVGDVIANVTGAVIGLAIVIAVSGRTGPGSVRPARSWRG